MQPQRTGFALNPEDVAEAKADAAAESSRRSFQSSHLFGARADAHLDGAHLHEEASGSRDSSEPAMLIPTCSLLVDGIDDKEAAADQVARRKTDLECVEEQMAAEALTTNIDVTRKPREQDCRD